MRQSFIAAATFIVVFGGLYYFMNPVAPLSSQAGTTSQGSTTDATPSLFDQLFPSGNGSSSSSTRSSAISPTSLLPSSAKSIDNASQHGLPDTPSHGIGSTILKAITSAVTSILPESVKQFIAPGGNTSTPPNTPTSSTPPSSHTTTSVSTSNQAGLDTVAPSSPPTTQPTNTSGSSPIPSSSGLTSGSTLPTTPQQTPPSSISTGAVNGSTVFLPITTPPAQQPPSTSSASKPPTSPTTPLSNLAGLEPTPFVPIPKSSYALEISSAGIGSTNIITAKKGSSVDVTISAPTAPTINVHPLICCINGEITTLKDNKQQTLTFTADDSFIFYILWPDKTNPKLFQGSVVVVP